MINNNIKLQQWQNLTMPNDTTIFHKMCRVDNYYWAVDYGYGGVYHSKDDGENWLLQYETQGEFLEAIQFLDKNTGYLCGDYGIIMKSTNGGKNWNEIGPKYSSRITKANPMKEDGSALAKYFYQMYFKNKEEGLVWDYEVFPQQGGWESRKTYFYKTTDGGNSWEKIEYKEEEYERVITDFVSGMKLQQEAVMDLYYANDKIYRTGRFGKEGLKISKDDGKSWKTYPLPQFPHKRYILRSIHFINDQQGYILGGSHAKENTVGYIIETLDGGKSWHFLETDLPHIHYCVQNSNKLLLSGKDNMLKKCFVIDKEE